MSKSFSKLRTQILFATIFFVLLSISGCGNYVQFGGKVTDSDGQPYTKGYVMFTNNKFSARGQLQPDGTYQLDSRKSGDGLAPGDYQVCISGHHKEINGFPVSDIDAKYESGSTSGLSCKVTKGGHFDFTVELKKK
jgi:hypothetical protein